MKSLHLKNKNLIKILYNISNRINDKEFQKRLDEASVPDIRIKNDFDPCSIEYLNKALETPLEYGYPGHAYGMGVKEYIKDSELVLQKTLMNEISELQIFLGTSRNALSMYYPKDGYIGWHHNGNAPGYNILFTFNTTKQGAFYHYDLDAKKIITMPDCEGWNVKAGRYPCEKKEPDNLFWHCADTKSPRLTVAFVIDNKLLWEDMIDEIQDED